MSASLTNLSTYKPSCRLIISGAAHVDRTGWLAAPSALGCSNPGRFEETLGGSALNVASVVATLGIRPELVSLVAKDAAGVGLRAEMTARGIVAHVDGKTHANTGTYTCLIEPDGSLVIGMADMAIYDDFSAQEIISRVESLTPDDWLCVDTNLPSCQIRQMLDASSSNKVGLTVSKAKAPRLREYADQLDMIFTNRVEVCALCGFDEDTAQTADYQTIATGLMDMGIDCAVISDGVKDVTIVDQGKLQSMHVRPVKHVADVTGAGDALVGASLFALMCEVPLAKSVEIGIKAAQATIQSKGALRSDLARLIGVSGHTL